MNIAPAVVVVLVVVVVVVAILVAGLVHRLLLVAKLFRIAIAD